MLVSILYSIFSFLAKAACIVFIPLFYIGLYEELKK